MCVTTAPACVTVIGREIPLTLTVTVPVRLVVFGFAVALIRNEPFPVVFAGVAFVIVSQVTLLEKLHLAFDVTVIVRLSAPAPKLTVVGDTVSLDQRAQNVTLPGAHTAPKPLPLLLRCKLLNHRLYRAGVL